MITLMRSQSLHLLRQATQEEAASRSLVWHHPAETTLRK